MTVQRILTINTGSSSLKVGLNEMGRDETRILTGEVDRIGVYGGRFRLKGAHGATLIDQGGDFPNHGAEKGRGNGGTNSTNFTAGEHRKILGALRPLQEEVTVFRV
jgi:hypothetical protein